MQPAGLHLDPFMGLFAALSSGQHGDFVTSQEAMDRIVSQLMEQTATSNAPGPASQADIDALPRKKVTRDMLGDDGNADCSICMDAVTPEEEVTELPCKHWFHHQCVSAWLKEHDTCPHCRKGITKTDDNAPKDASSSGATAGSSADPTANMPGAFGVTGEGTSNNPFLVPGSSSPAPAPDSYSGAQQGHSGANDGSNNHSNAAERRGWWP
jgi:E3 ubiquitin-protein ligase RNF115/126